MENYHELISSLDHHFERLEHLEGILTTLNDVLPQWVLCNLDFFADQVIINVSPKNITVVRSALREIYPTWEDSVSNILNFHTDLWAVYYANPNNPMIELRSLVDENELPRYLKEGCEIKKMTSTSKTIVCEKTS